MKGIISSRWYSRQSSLLWTSKTANMSRETNEVVMMRCKKITSNLSTIVHLLVEPIKYLAKPKSSIEESLYIRQPPWTVTYSNPVISPPLYSFFSFVNMLISNRYWSITVLSYVVNSSRRCRGINTTGKMKSMASKNCISIVGLIKGGVCSLLGYHYQLKNIV